MPSKPTVTATPKTKTATVGEVVELKVTAAGTTEPVRIFAEGSDRPLRVGRDGAVHYAVSEPGTVRLTASAGDSDPVDITITVNPVAGDTAADTEKE